MGRLTDKNILITGGNSGIGLATAQEFDREGARVAICGLNERTLQAAKGTLGAGSLAVRADVSKLADLDTVFATIKREFGHLDGLFVNAGYSEFLPFEEVTEQSFDMVIGSNFKGAYFTIQKALPLLRPGSSVVINASVGARKGWPTTSTVSTCKAAVVHLARILSAELVGRGIRREYPKPRPDGHGDVRSLRRRRAGRRGQGRPCNQQSQQADGRSVGNREAGGLSRVGRFRVHRRSRLPDRRRGLSHFARGRLSFVAESTLQTPANGIGENTHETGEPGEPALVVGVRLSPHGPQMIQWSRRLAGQNRTGVGTAVPGQDIAVHPAILGPDAGNSGSGQA